MSNSPQRKQKHSHGDYKTASNNA